MISIRSHAVVLLPVVLALVGPPARAQTPETPTVREQVEVREVGVVADLPPGYRGRSSQDLAGDLTIVEGGVTRQPMSVTPLGGEGANDYSRVLVVFDTARCDNNVLSDAASALGDHAAALVALGPVEISLLGSELEPRLVHKLDRTLSSSEAAAALAQIAREQRCGPPPPPDRLRAVTLDARDLDCPARPCLLVWAGPGWGAPPSDGGKATPPPEPAAVEPLARTLAARGWVVLAAPIGSVPPPKNRRSIPEPQQTRPGSDRYTFGVNVLDPQRQHREPLSPEEYSALVDVWLAPLRQLAASTAGEVAVEAGALDGALRSLAGRSILWYRTDRPPGREPPKIVVRAKRGAQTPFRTAEWAPTL